MNIRNFAIIAHIDHGKSTLADRIMELCGAVEKGHREQLLDSLELEREHGITIKLKAIRLKYTYSTLLGPQSEGRGPHGIVYTFNLLDTPGHVDFSYEVSRSLASVEGALLVVDATQGLQAQTLSNFNLAVNAGLHLIPVINKIDMPASDVKKTSNELMELGFLENEIIKVSAKTGEGVGLLLEEIVKKIPPPTFRHSELNFESSENKHSFSTNKPSYSESALQALIFDSSLDPYKGVIASIRLFAGEIKSGDKIKLVATDTATEILQLGFLTPKPEYVEKLTRGEIGFIVTNLKNLSKVKVGDTVTLSNNPAPLLPGYQEAKPVVFLSFFPADSADFSKLKEGFEKLKLNDAALTFTPESSISLGQGLRVGFLGLLHAQITQERLEREHNLDIVVTSPSVNFIIDGKQINKPSEFTGNAEIVKEPWAKVTIFAPQKYYGVVTNMVYEKRGQIENFENIGASTKIEANMPLLEILIGFYDDLKSQTSGYASFDFEVTDYKEAKLVKLDILVNYEPVEGLAQVVPTQKAEDFGRKLVEKLKEIIPRQNIPIPVQAVINYQKIKGGVGSPTVASAKVGGKILARETIPAYRKDVTAKLYGGDVTRKMKLLEKQKKGKKRMKRFGNVDIPQEAFLAVLKI
ncbi:GTP-binding protein [Candidatus Curtissbacteria bacterium]|nr:GTP-binding protein [Candidatus Curtissbacteria bacterium]